MSLQQGLVRLGHVGLSFSPAGLLTPFHMGVRAQLERADLPGALPACDRSRTPFSGASGGAIAAASAALGMDPREALRACVQVSDTFEAGATLRGALDPVLEELIPQDAVPMLQARQAQADAAAAAAAAEVVGNGGTTAPGSSFGSSSPVPRNSLTVSYFEVYPQRRARHVTTFEDRSDLIDCIRASCSVPLYFNGIAGLPSRVRGGWAVDGIFASPLARFGCPSTGADFELLSCPFPGDSVGLRGVLDKSAVISPSVLAPLLDRDSDSDGDGDSHDVHDGTGTSTSSTVALLQRSVDDAAVAGVDVALALAACQLAPTDRLRCALRPAPASVAKRLLLLKTLTRAGTTTTTAAAAAAAAAAAPPLLDESTSAGIIYSALFHQGALCARVVWDQLLREQREQEW